MRFSDSGFKFGYKTRTPIAKTKPGFESMDSNYEIRLYIYFSI